MRIWYVPFGALSLWAVFGNPTNDFAGLLWPDRPAPWEQVDAVYYPDRRRLSAHRIARGVGSLDACWSCARAMADAHGDAGLPRGDDATVYRITAR